MQEISGLFPEYTTSTVNAHPRCGTSSPDASGKPTFLTAALMGVHLTCGVRKPSARKKNKICDSDCETSKTALEDVLNLLMCSSGEHLFAR
jgi:hypothetical protein